MGGFQCLCVGGRGQAEKWDSLSPYLQKRECSSKWKNYMLGGLPEPIVYRNLVDFFGFFWKGSRGGGGEGGIFGGF